MSFLSKTGLRRRLLALATFAAVSALSAAPALADHGHHGGGFWFPPIPQIFVPFPPVVIVGGPHGHDCDYDDHHHYDYDDHHHYDDHRYYYDGGGHGYRGDYRGEWRHHGRGHHYGHGHHEHGGYDD
jgi:hypothetical protein